MHVEFLRDGGSALPRHPMAEDVESLKIWHCKFKSFEALRDYRALRCLVIAGFPAESFAIPGALSHLRELRVLHFPKVTELEPLSGLRELEMLALETLPSWDASRKRQRVASLAPIAALENLRSVELLGVVPDEGGLAPLYACQRLTEVKLLGYSEKERAALFQALPRLAEGRDGAA